LWQNLIRLQFMMQSNFLKYTIKKSHCNCNAIWLWLSYQQYYSHNYDCKLQFKTFFLRIQFKTLIKKFHVYFKSFSLVTINYKNTCFISLIYNMMLKNNRQIISRRPDVSIYYVQVLFKLVNKTTLVDNLTKHPSTVERWLKSQYLLFRSFLYHKLPIIRNNIYVILWFRFLAITIPHSNRHELFDFN
jgi:hypothetical protein